jgi:diguanylate cyclase (GGDEF)-like protein
MAAAKLGERLIRLWRPLRGIALVILAAILVLYGACLTVLYQSRVELVRRADIMASNILVLADETVGIEVQRHDLRLLDVITDLHDSPKGSGGVLDPALFGGMALRNSIGDIIVVDARGRVLASSRPTLTPHYTVALPAIVSAPGQASLGLGVSTVSLSGSGPPMVALMRRCAPGACGPAAAVIAMLPMTWIQSGFDGLFLGRNGAIALTDDRGTLLARQPYLPDAIGHRFVAPSLIARVPHGAAAIYNKRSAVDGLCCRVTAGWIDGLPLLVFVSISRADILRGWSHLAVVILFAVVVLSGGLVVLTLLLARQVNRKLQVDRQLVSANTRLAELARTDALTGLLNRRGFDEVMAREWWRARRETKPISLLMLDVDRFKIYNDHFGHPAGDGVLRALGACILSHIRPPGDVAARYGGEEFTVILPDTDLAGAAEVAEAIRAGVEGLAMPHAESGVVLTVSIGAAAFTAAGAIGTAEALLAAADAALYESKGAGRNRVTLRTVTPPQPAAEPARA